MFPGRLVQCSAIFNRLKNVKISEGYGNVTQKIGPVSVENIAFTKTAIYRLISTDTELNSPVKMARAEPRNRLAKEKSPYLLQHAANPVDWYPWGEEAFEKARSEDKLIFLSVGYSTCHWCHVMERESFESSAVAAIMNEHFVNIKVDREERPDVDEIYMTFVQVSAGGGGWPMSVFLTPDLKPIAGGTYFPPEDNFGRPGFKSILHKVAKQWKDDRQKVSFTSKKIVEILRKTTVFDIGMADALVSGKVPGSACSKLCLRQLANHYEPLYGGFGLAPKFPQPSNLEFLIYMYAKDPLSDAGREAHSMAMHTLKMMERGGIHDHIAQGFARYSTDEKWHVPHFEKMLYDQGQIAVVYCQGYLISKNARFAETVEDILTYVSRDLSHPQGGFYSAEDADSLPTEDAVEKREGAFCVWSYDDVSNLLSASLEENPDVLLADVFCHHYNVKPEGNVDPNQDPHKELEKQNVLIEKYTDAQTGEKFGITGAQVKAALAKARSILLDARKNRPRPHLDNKIITSWNGLMISGYAYAGNTLKNENYVKRAVQAAEFIKKHMYDRSTKRLLRSCYTDSDGTIVQINFPISGFLDDYAFLIRGLIDLYEASFDPSWLEWAYELQQTQDSLFWDNGSAGYFSTPSTAGDQIIFKLKDDQDGAEPSGNSISVQNLLRLSAILDLTEYNKKAGEILSMFTSRLTSSPAALPQMSLGLMMFNDSLTHIVVTGKQTDAGTQALLSTVRSHFVPGGVVMLADDDASSVVYRRSEMIRRMKPINGKATAYVCRQRTCSLPVNTTEELTDLLAEQRAP